MNKMGFGFLRLPFQGELVDYGLLNQMVDLFLQRGGRYFDTAYTYLAGKSEAAIRESVVKRYRRNEFILADKLPGYMVKSHDECYRYFDEQLQRCGVDFFDVYLLHWLNAANYAVAEKYSEFDFLQELKRDGKAKKIGFSYHDSAALLDKILSKHPEVDIVQLQINYLDWDSAGIEAKKCYEVAVKHGKSVVVMEPVKGGTLANVSNEVEELFKGINENESPASWALRFVQSLPQVDIVLSGMSTMEQMADNMRDVQPLTEQEQETVRKAADIISKETAIPCTGCRYCVEYCPKKIAIPDYFKMYNEIKRYPGEGWKIKPVYNDLAKSHGKASECISCRNCEKHCPQKIEIAKFMREVANSLE